MSDLVKRLRKPCFERGLDELWIDAQRSDAALALHQAVLPCWDCDLELRPLGSTIDTGLSDVSVYQPYSDSPFKGTHATPARAWLLAIFKALHEMENPDG